MLQRNVQKFIVGSALVIATTAILPIAREVLRPVVRDLSRHMKFLIVSTKEGLEDMAAEVRFERMKKQLHHRGIIDSEYEIQETTEQILH